MHIVEAGGGALTGGFCPDNQFVSCCGVFNAATDQTRG